MRFKNFLILAAVALFALGAASGVFGARAHTYHTSLARMDYNAGEKTIEISLQLFTHDLQPLLERRMKKRVDLEKTAGVDEEIFKYVGENFVFQTKAGDTPKLEWVGREFEQDTVFVYVQIPFEGAFDGARLQNTLFFESFAEQTNLVVARFGEKKYDLLYKSGDKFKDLAEKPPEKPTADN
ncbi:MAG: hypothetical protein JSS81_07850 [Acidobacteria bacterium]|nr:hypothetical protein [Acidobacteriota bacterium]